MEVFGIFGDEPWDTVMFASIIAIINLGPSPLGYLVNITGVRGDCPDLLSVRAGDVPFGEG